MSLQSLPTELLYQIHLYLTHKSAAKFSFLYNLYFLSTKEVQCLYITEYPWFKVCKLGFIQALKLILNNGFDIESRNYYGDTALSLASIYGNKECVLLLLNNSANVNNTVLHCNNTILHCAINNNRTECLELLLDYKAKINLKNYDGNTALHHACSCGYERCAQILLDHGADPNIQNNLGDTPLHRACLSNSKECIKLLLKNGVDTSIQNIYGSTALHFASRYEPECEKILVAHKQN